MEINEKQRTYIDKKLNSLKQKYSLLSTVREAVYFS